ncbi:pilus assembly protein PilQ [Methylophaga sp. 42_25_T18]|nr:pilus assembly protein PilQ [Methylophaga sp. 42_25_T18]
MTKVTKSLITLYLMLFASFSVAADLQSIGYSSLPGDKAQIVLTFSETVDELDSFAIDEPARIVLDFAGVTNQLDKKTQQVNIGLTKSVSTVEAGGRTRMVVNLVKTAPYTIEQDGNVVMVTIGGGSQNIAKAGGEEFQVTDIDFRRGEQGEARLMILLSKEGAIVDVHQERDTIVVDLIDVALPENLHRRLDVVDFATPVQIIESEQSGHDTQLILSTSGKFEHLVYQSDNTLVIEVKPVVIDVQSADRKDQFGYKGEKLSLNFQNIEVRAVLQLLADFTGMNLVTSDTVQGNLTLRLKNVPWDQALDIILKTKGLAMRQNGNVMLVAPAAEITAREKQELEAQKQLVELEPLYSEILEINFAKASELATILESDSGSGASGEVTGFISERGSITVDERTNSLLIRDTADQLVQITQLIERLDIPVRQVLIESRIVIANDDFTKDLGVKFGASGHSETAGVGFSGSADDLGVTGRTIVQPKGDLTDSLNVDFGLAAGSPTFALALAKLPFNAILELELSALQAEGRGEVISSPRVITSNQQTAIIEQGTEIPYQEASSSGATSVSFKEALLRLEVTPQITPDDHIVMDLKVNKDEAVFDAAFAVPSIRTQAVETQVIVDNGETVILGGIYEQEERKTTSRVPFFGDLPYVGFLFKTTKDIDDNSELLIFVTPKIIKESLKF